MPRTGGEADKFGNRYEGLWVVDAALDLIDGEFVDLVVEAVGDEAAGVEFFRTTSSGIREYHSSRIIRVACPAGQVQVPASRSIRKSSFMLQANQPSPVRKAWGFAV